MRAILRSLSDRDWYFPRQLPCIIGNRVTICSFTALYRVLSAQPSSHLSDGPRGNNDGRNGPAHKALTMHGRSPNSTFATKQLDMDCYQRLAARSTVCALLLFVFGLMHPMFHFRIFPLSIWFERPSGLLSTLPHLGRIHIVDRMRAWTLMRKPGD